MEKVYVCKMHVIRQPGGDEPVLDSALCQEHDSRQRIEVIDRLRDIPAAQFMCIGQQSMPILRRNVRARQKSGEPELSVQTVEMLPVERDSWPPREVTRI